MEPPGAGAPPPVRAQGLQQRIQTLSPTHPTIIADTCVAVGRTAKHHKLPHRGSIPLTAAQRVGSIIQIDVSKDCLERALLLADRLIRTAEAIGWPLTDSPPPEPKEVHRNDAMKRWLVPIAGFDGHEARKLTAVGIHEITSAGDRDTEKTDCESEDP